MRCLVTGSAGFVGTHLLALLDGLGHESVGFDRATDGPDLLDRESVTRSIAAAEPDVVFHLAGQSHVPTSWDDPIGTLRTNVEGTQNVLDASHASSAARTIVVTSAEVYGHVAPVDLPIAESRAFRPVTPYAASKAAADLLALQVHLGRGQDVIRVRAFNHLGPGQRPTFVAAGLAARIAEAERLGEPMIDVGNLDSRRDFTDVRDVVRAYVLLAEAGVAGEAYNVCSGRDVAVSAIAAGLLAHTTSPMTLVTDPELVRPVDVPVVRGDNTKLVAHTGWQPEISLDRSLADVLDGARRRLAS